MDMSVLAAVITALHCGHLVDPVAGKLLGETTIVVEGKRIREVTSGAQSPAGRKPRQQRMRAMGLVMKEGTVWKINSAAVTEDLH